MAQATDEARRTTLRYTPAPGAETTYLTSADLGGNQCHVDAPELIAVDVRDIPETVTQVDLRTPTGGLQYWAPHGNDAGLEPMDRATADEVAGQTWPAAAIEAVGYEVA